MQPAEILSGLSIQNDAVVQPDRADWSDVAASAARRKPQAVQSNRREGVRQGGRVEKAHRLEPLDEPHLELEVVKKPQFPARGLDRIFLEASDRVVASVKDQLLGRDGIPAGYRLDA